MPRTTNGDVKARDYFAGEPEVRAELVRRIHLLAAAWVPLVLAALVSARAPLYRPGALTVMATFPVFVWGACTRPKRPESFDVRAAAFVLNVCALGLVTLVERGPNTGVGVAFCTGIVIAGLFLGRRVAWMVAGVMVVTFLAAGMAVSAQRIDLPRFPDDLTRPFVWLRLGITLALVGTLLVSIVTTLVGHSEAARARTARSLASLREAEVERQRAYDRLQRLVRDHRALSMCNQMLVRADNEPDWVQQVCEIIVEQAGYRMCWVGYAEHDASRTVRPVARAGFDNGYVDQAKITWADDEHGAGPTGTCIRTGTATITQDIASDPREAPWREEARRRGYASAVALPLRVDAETIGALMIYAAEPDGFGQDEVALLTELASDLAYGISTLRVRTLHSKGQEDLRVLNEELEKRVIDRTQQLIAARGREAETGSRIQQMLLLDSPPQKAPGLHVAAFTIPAEQIGGDSYGFLVNHEKQCLDLFIADVMGKGVPAALLSAAVKSHFPEAIWHLMAGAHPGELPEPRDVVTFVHSQMERELVELESFVTLLYARIDRPAKRMHFVDCGHTGVVHLHSGEGRCSLRSGTNVPLGVIEGELFGQVSVPFETGDTFLLFSDGVTEARNARGDLFGTDRLMECVERNALLEPTELIEMVRDTALAFSGPRRLRDDLTCVAVKVVDYETPLAHAELELTSDLAELGRARRFVQGFCAEPERPFLESRRLGDLTLAVNEALANIIEHAYGGMADQRVHVSAEAFRRHVSVRLRHTGKAFDDSRVAPPTFDGSRDSGFGVYLIGKLVDSVRYHRDELGRNCVDLEQRRPATLQA